MVPEIYCPNTAHEYDKKHKSGKRVSKGYKTEIMDFTDDKMIQKRMSDGKIG
ncbi:MAG: hypothetical protein WC947_08585 [Elusimicrobiota bacterium]